MERINREGGNKNQNIKAGDTKRLQHSAGRVEQNYSKDIFLHCRNSESLTAVFDWVEFW